MQKIFEGTKIIEFVWGAAGPIIGREMASHGAEVIRIESHRRLDFHRLVAPYKDNISGLDRGPCYACYHAGKYGISLELNKPKGQEVARKLVNWADIIVESFTPGTMKRWGLDYRSVNNIKPEIIYLSTTQQGQYGPHARFAGLGFQAAALSGFALLTGWSDRGPSMMYGPYTDFIAPWYALAALTAALLYRRRTGKGMYLEQSQLEAAITLLSPATLDYIANGREASRLGNHHPYAAPHGVYRCLGEDRWVTIAIFNDEEWKSFCQTIGSPEWARSERFSTFRKRKENEDELDMLIEAWTINYTPNEIMNRLQAVGVSAGIVESNQDCFEDPQLKYRDAFTTLNHGVIGPHAYRNSAYKLSKVKNELKSAAPCLGEHNEYVYKELLGFSDDDIADMLIDGTITTEADLLKSG